MTITPEAHLDERWLVQIETDLLVINKPPGLSVLRDRSGEVDLWQRLTARFGKLYLVHRLDKGTSGLLMFTVSTTLSTIPPRSLMNPLTVSEPTRSKYHSTDRS